MELEIENELEGFRIDPSCPAVIIFQGRLKVQGLRGVFRGDILREVTFGT